MRRSLPFSLVLLGLLCLAGCKEQLYTRLSEREANEMVAVLTASGIGADKVDAEEGRFKVEVERSQFGPATELLHAHGLPQSRFNSIGDVFKKDGLVSTANAERLRFVYAMSEELSNTLSQIDGVVLARVHPVMPSTDPLSDKVTPASASVFIKHTADANLSVLAPAIKDMVSASIEGLSYDKISLTFVAAQPLGRHAADPAAAAGERWPWYAHLALAAALAAALGLGAYGRDALKPGNAPAAKARAGARSTLAGWRARLPAWLAERLGA